MVSKKAFPEYQAAQMLEDMSEKETIDYVAKEKYKLLWMLHLP